MSRRIFFLFLLAVLLLRLLRVPIAFCVAFYILFIIEEAVRDLRRMIREKKVKRFDLLPISVSMLALLVFPLVAGIKCAVEFPGRHPRLWKKLDR